MIEAAERKFYEGKGHNCKRRKKWLTRQYRIRRLAPAFVTLVQMEGPR